MTVKIKALMTHHARSNIVSRWRGDDALMRLFKNAGILFSGTAAAALLALGSNVLAARYLGPSHFGILALISTYAFVMFGLFSFQSWQALINYGTHALENNRREDFQSLMKFGFLLDAGACLAGTLAAIAGVYVYGHIAPLESKAHHLAILFCLSILFRLTNTPTAILRMFDRFHLFPIQQVLAAVVRLGCVVVLYLRRESFAGFVYLWLGTEVLGYLILYLMGWRELSRRGFRKVMRSPLTGLTHKFPGLWKFVVTTNIHSSLRIVVREFDILFVGGMLGTSAAGLYKVVRQFSQVLQRIVDPLYQAIYPDLSKNWMRQDFDRFQRLLQRPALILAFLGGTLWLGFLLFGKWILNVTVGKLYADSYLPILAFTAGILLSMATFSFQPAMLAMGKPGQAFQVYFVSSTIYVGLLFTLTPALGILGTALSLVGFYLVWSLLMASRISGQLKKAKRHFSHGEP